MNMELIFIATLVFILFQAARIVVNIKSTMRYRKIRLTEQIRSEFAEARTVFFHEIMKKKINPDGDLARAFYSTLTFLIRNPDNFESIARGYLRTLRSSKKTHAAKLAQEFDLWPENCQRYFANMVSSMNKLSEICVPFWGQLLVIALKFLIRKDIITDSMRKSLLAYIEGKKGSEAISELEAFNHRFVKA